jgi:inosine-uridine nucleoside N-ribohydrolase
MEKLNRIWIDTDIALGSSGGDVDDGFALAAVLAAARNKSNAIEIAGISVVSGNTDSETALLCVKRLLALFPNQTAIKLIPQCDAAASIATLNTDISILALGPLTNIANAYDINPKIAQTTRLYWVGGVANRLSLRRRLSNLNVKRDKAAANLVLCRWQSIYQFPLDMVDRLGAGSGELIALENCSEVGAYLAHQSQRWLRTSWFRHGKARFPIWDLVAALSAIGYLPNARFDERQRLIDFDHQNAWSNFLKIVADDLVRQPIFIA